MLVDESTTCTEHRLYCVYGLTSREAPRHYEGSFFGDVYDLGRYTGHYRAASEVAPGVVAVSEFAGDGFAVPEAAAGLIESGRMALLAVPTTGYVLVLELVSQAPIDKLAEITAATCFNREQATVDARPLLEALATVTPKIRLAGLALGRDVHQLWFLSDNCTQQVVHDSTDHSPVYDMNELLGVVYRSRVPQRPNLHSVRFPKELNRAVGSLACHARGVTVAGGQPVHTEHAMTLIASQLVASLSRLRQIRKGTAEALRTLRDPRLTRLSLDAQRRQFAELAAEATNLEVDLSFGVEGNLDSVLVPEIVLESYRTSLGEAMGLPEGLDATSHMLARLTNALKSTEQKIASAAKERDELRSSRISAAVAYASIVAIPIGLFFAYFAVPDRVKEHTSLLNVHKYWGIYMLLGVLLVVGSGAVYGLAVARQWRRKVQEARVARQVRISAHRGGAGKGILPTVASFQAAVEMGAELVEFDVRRTSDGVLVACHDEHTPDGRTIAETPWADYHAELRESAIQLTDILPVLRERALAHVDLKEVGYESDVVRLCLEALGVDGFLVTTLEDESVRRIKQEFPEVHTALSLGRDMDGRPLRDVIRVRLSEIFPERRLAACGADAVAVHHRLASLRVRRICGKLGLPVMVWTVNDTGMMKRLLRLESVDVLITDDPAAAISLRSAIPMLRPSTVVVAEDAL